ncbi:MAG: helix-turn-helix transcriptional regulator [Flavobacteriales bacterium]|nr:helix-turn-helix transcriptional regulator [Flavobacteriales bacterium]
MNEKIHILPNELSDGKNSETNICFYKTNKSSKNNKVTFQQNLICILQAGEKEISGVELNEKFDNKTIFLLQTGNVLMTEKTTNENEYKSILLFFSDKYFIEFKNRYNLNFSIYDAKLNSIKIIKNEYIDNFEKSLEFLEKGLENTNLLNLKLDEILLYLFQNYREKLAPIFKNIQSRNQNLELINVVHNNLNSNLTIEELAFLCNMSISTFKRKFVETFHTTPKKYFIQHRMQKAVTYLQQKKKPSEIYFDLGYENLSAFSNEFKKYFGVSPKTYILQS